MISIIAARSKDNIIGLDGDLPWREPNDMKFFNMVTMGGIVVMGRKTYESIPKKFRPLPGRKNVVLSKKKGRSMHFSGEGNGISIYGNLKMVLNHLKESDKEIFIAGGGQIYDQLVDEVSRFYITDIDITVANNSTKEEQITRFPDVDFSSGDFKRVFYAENMQSKIRHSFSVYDRL